MKLRNCFLLLAVLCLFLTACGETETKRPIDYPNTKWTCESAGISFTVSKNSEISDAEIVSRNGETLKITLDFSDVGGNTVSIMDANGEEIYFSGNCTYGKDEFTITLTNIYNTDFSNMPVVMIFKGSDI